MLIPASIVGVIVFLYGCATVDDNIPRSVYPNPALGALNSSQGLAPLGKELRCSIDLLEGYVSIYFCCVYGGTLTTYELGIIQAFLWSC